MKSKVLATATEMFLNFGFKSVTMDDIAQKMCILKKDDILALLQQTKTR